MSADTSSSPSQQLEVERLGKHHDRKSFVSGVAELDEYFRKQAGQDARSGIAAPFYRLFLPMKTIKEYPEEPR